MSSETSIKGEKVSKDSCLVETLGRLDSLQCQLDKCCYYAPAFEQYFRHVQHNLNDVGAELSKFSEHITPHDIAILDSFILLMNISPPQNFVRFTNLISMEINEARVRARDFERALVACNIRQECKDYTNKLSYFLFILSLKVEGLVSVEQDSNHTTAANTT